MKELIIIGSESVHIKCLKNFLINEIFKTGHFLYFESIRHLLDLDRIDNGFIVIFDNRLNIRDFIELCILYGSENIKIVTYEKNKIIKEGIQRIYKIENFMISIQYDQKDFFMDTWIVIVHGRKEIFLRTEEIYYIDCYYRNIYIYTCHGCYEQKDHFSQLYETVLRDCRFIKIRKGCYVNRMYLKDIKNNMVVLTNDIILGCSKICLENMFG